jgi:hypothetical protein
MKTHHLPNYRPTYKYIISLVISHMELSIPEELIAAQMAHLLEIQNPLFPTEIDYFYQLYETDRLIPVCMFRVPSLHYLRKEPKCLTLRYSYRPRIPSSKIAAYAILAITRTTEVKKHPIRKISPTMFLNCSFQLAGCISQNR